MLLLCCWVKAQNDKIVIFETRELNLNMISGFHEEYFQRRWTVAVLHKHLRLCIPNKSSKLAAYGACLVQLLTCLFAKWQADLKRLLAGPRDCKMEKKKKAAANLMQYGHLEQDNLTTSNSWNRFRKLFEGLCTTNEKRTNNFVGLLSVLACTRAGSFRASVNKFDASFVSFSFFLSFF